MVQASKLLSWPQALRAREIYSLHMRAVLYGFLMSPSTQSRYLRSDGLVCQTGTQDRLRSVSAALDAPERSGS